MAIIDKYKAVRDRESQASKVFGDIRIHNKNLTGVLLMCQRHPALHLSLVKELELKVQVRKRSHIPLCPSFPPISANPTSMTR